jgi:general secretion pathway protein A
MYARHFGLETEPFSIAPDPRFLFMSERHREALAHLLYGLGGGGGFVLLSGEIGAGKTTVCRCFLEQVPATCTVAYIFNPRLTVAELLQTVADEFGIALPPGAGGKVVVDALNAFLLRLHAEGRQAALVIDEAQALSAEVLEQLRLLTNLETAERKLLQIVLIGQPELRTLLARPELEQLSQRVIARYHLGALSAAETVAYVRHRLAVAGARGDAAFDTAALADMHRLTGGLPRRINLLADRALLGAYAQGRSRVDRRTLRQAAREVAGDDGTPPPGRASGRAWAGGALAGAGVAALVAALAWAWWPAPLPGTAAVVSAPAILPPAAASAASVPASAGAAASVTVPQGAQPPAGPAVGAAPTEPAATDPAPLLAAAHRSEALAWRELALRWNVAIGEGDACTAAAQAALQCFRAASGGLPLVQQLARPGIVTLRGDGGSVHALLVALAADGATLQVGAERYRLTLPALARVWRGDYATFWRAPPGWRGSGDALAQPDSREWLADRLRAAGAPDGRPLREQVYAFQLAQGLPADGLVGPRTLMQLNRATGVDEPRLEGGS